MDLGLSVLLSKEIGILKGLSARAKIENVLNQRYEEAFGFPAPGLLYLLGLQATF
jgi:outer membrane receptor protein involved in Fe transport